MRKYLLLSAALLASLAVLSQDFSNKGKDFYLCFPQHVPNSNTNLATLSIFITSDQASSGTITMPNAAYSGTFNIAANGLQEIQIPWNANIHISNGESSNETVTQILKKAIHIKVDVGKPPVVAYAQQWAGARSCATLLLPSNVMGKKYYAVSFAQNGSNQSTFNARSQFQIIAINDNTVVQITPRKNGVQGTPFTITLPLAGDMIQYQSPDASAATQDLTGTLIESIASGSGGCLPIAVFSGSSNITFGTATPNCNGGSYDPLWQQLYPVTTWGKNFGFMPFQQYPNGNPYRVMASEDNTVVSFNGAVVATLNKGEIYPAAFTSNPVVLTAPTSISADKPITVTQYAQADACTGQTGGGRVGDPDMVILNPIEQNIKDITIFSSTRQAITKQWINVLLPSVDTTTFTINGTRPATSWQLFAALPGYSYLRHLLPGAGSYRLKADTGFNAIAYGWGNVESYAYSAGTNVIDLSQQLEIQTQYGIETTPSVCTNAPFKFKIYFPHFNNATPAQHIPFDSLDWNLTNPGIIVPNNFPIRQNSPTPIVPDSTTTVNGKQVDWYSLPGTYYFNAPGNDTLIVTGYKSTNEGCGNTLDYPFPIVITDPPVGDFTWSGGGCPADPVKFLETTPQFPKTTYHFWWDFGDPASGANNNSALRNPTHTYTAPGTYTVRYSSITTSGCLSDTISHTIVIPDLPIATISGNTTVCINSAPKPDITFTGSLGTPEYYFDYNIDNGSGPGPTLTAGPSVANTITVQAPTNVAGTFVYTLLSVRNAGASVCTQNIAGQKVTIVILPDHTISLTSGNSSQTVCINTPIVPITYTLGGGATGANVTGLPAGLSYAVVGTTLTISGSPTTTVGSPFNFNIVTTGNACLTASANGSITVTPDHTISLTSANASQTVCINNPITPITYTLGGGATGGTVTGLPAGVTSSVVGNTLTISGTPSTTAGSPFNFSITTTGNSCITATASGTLTVLPDHTISLTSGNANQTVCVNTAIVPITYTLGGGATGGTVTGLPPGVSSAVAGTVLTISGTPTTAVGSPFNYSITTTGNSCVTATVTGTITVNPDHTISLTSANASQTVCINTPIVPITYTLGGGATGGTVTGLPAGLTSSVVGTTLTISGSPSTTVGSPFNFSITTTGNSCITATANGTITVLPDHTLTLTSANANQTVCINTPIVPITYTLGGGATGGTVTGLPAGVTSSVAGTTLTISGTPTTTVGSPFLFSITTTGNSCITATLGGSITVNPDHTLTLTSAPATTNQAVCMNVAITPITYTLGGGATGATVTGLPAGVTSSVVGTTLTISGAPSTAVGSPFNYSITTTGNTCLTATLGGTITVHRLPTPNFNYTVPSCDTRTITFTDASVANSGVLNSWAWDFGDPASGANNTSPLQNPSHVFTATGSYTVTLNITTDLGCTIAVPFAKVVTIHNRPQAGFMIPEVCINDVAAVFTDTSHLTAPDTFDPPNCTWNYGDPASGPLNTSTGLNGTHLYTATGVYQVTHVVTSLAGCKDTIVQPITINGANPTAAFTVLAPANLCANDSVAIVNNSLVNFGNVTKVEIWWDNVGAPAVSQVDDFPFYGKVYRHLYPNFQAPPTRNYTIKFRAYSGTLCFNDVTQPVTIHAAPKVQFNAIPDTCLLVAPFQLTQASEIGGVPGTGTYSGPGVTATGIFSPAAAGIGTHTIKYTFVSAFGCTDTMSRTIRVLDTAHASFTYVAPICQSVPGSFTDVSTAPAGVVLANTVWDFGDGSGVQNHAPGSTFNHLFPGPGTYTVSMYNVSAYGCNSTIYSIPVTVDPNHIITLTSGAATTSQNVCINTAITPITYTLSGGATGATVTGLPAGVNFTVVGTTVTISGSPTTTTGSPFIYSVTTTGNTCTVATASGTIAVKPDHTIALTSPANSDNQSMCVNSPIDPITYILGGGATGATVSGLPAGVTYSVSGNILTISGTPTVTTGSPFNYTVTTTGNNCVTAGAAGVIKVNPYPAPNFSVDKTSYCIPNAWVQFTNGSTISDGSPMTYLWNFGDGSPTNSGVNPSHKYNGTGPYNVKLTAISTVVLTDGSIGCPHDTIIVLNTIHPQPKADFTKDKPSVCQGQAVTFTDNSDGKDGVINEWHWKMGDGSVRSTNPVTYTYSDSITYQVEYYSVNSIGCNSDTIIRPFTVYPLPHVNAGPDRFVLEGGSIVIEALTFGNDQQFVWSPNLYLVDNKVQQPRVLKPLSDMTYTLTVTARGGCQNSDAVFVKLLKFPTIPNTFTPNNDGINDTWRIDYLNTYPDNRVQVFTRTGQLVFESRGYNTPWDGTLKGKPLPVDTYYYIIEPGNGRDPITGYVAIIK